VNAGYVKARAMPLVSPSKATARRSALRSSSTSSIVNVPS
jgi:hypothetical protein